MPAIAEKTKPQVAKDKSKPYDVIVSLVHDNREGITRAVEKPMRYSYATEAEAQEAFQKANEALSE